MTNKVGKNCFVFDLQNNVYDFKTKEWRQATKEDMVIINAYLTSNPNAK